MVDQSLHSVLSSTKEWYIKTYSFVLLSAGKGVSCGEGGGAVEDDASVKDGTDGDSEKAMLEGREGEAGHSAGTEGGAGSLAGIGNGSGGTDSEFT